MEWFSILWLLLFVLFLLMESATVVVVSLWFAIGALAAMISSFFGAEIWLQAAVFFGVSVVLLCALRPLTKKYFVPKIIKTNVDAMTGATGRVVEAIQNDLSQGRVKLNGMEWSARASSGEVLEEGTLIKVDRVEGVKVYVTALEVKVN